MIKVKNISKKFGHLKVLNKVSFQVNQGEVVSIIGPSGSGKSTLLRCLIGLEEIDDGLIKIAGFSFKESNDIHKKMGMVFQSFNLFPHKTVVENIVEAPLIVNKKKKVEALIQAEQLLKKVGLLNKKDCYPFQLSGGEKQRVAIARALAMQPLIMLFDEPTSSLDPELVGEVLSVIKDLADERITMVIVTHEMGFAREISDRVLFMEKGEIICDAVPEKVFISPEQQRINDFFKKII